MIKRPLCLMLAAYVAGICLAWQQISFFLIIMFSLLIYLFIYLLMYRIRNKLINKQDRYMWILPLLLIAGCLATHDRLKKPELHSLFEQEISCELEGEISRITENAYGFSLYLKNNVISVPDGKEYLCNNIIVKNKYKLYNTDSNQVSADLYRIGNRVYVKGNLNKFSVARNPGGFNEQLYYQIEDIYFYVEAEQILITDPTYSIYHYLLGVLKNKLTGVYDILLSDKEAGTLIAMLLGDRSLLDDEVKMLYQENGITHILAISGLHISLIGMFFFKLLRKLKCPIKSASIITIFFIYSYGVLTDFSVSTNRAIVMMVISLLAPITGKAYDMLSAICLSALIILLQNPMQLVSAGFLLSYGAVLGIAVIYPALRQLFKSSEEAKLIKEGNINTILISISTQLSTIPIVLFFFYQIPTYSIIINLIILPLITILTLLAILGAIAGLIYLPIGVFIIGGASYILKLYELVCRLGVELPGNMLTVGKPSGLRILLYVIFLGAFLITVYKYKRKTTLIIMTVGLLLLILPCSSKGLEITFLDVGQGDAIYIKSNNNTTYLIDGGSLDVSKVGTYRISPFLLSRGNDVIDYAIITHSDKDHISGLSELINNRKIKIKNLILPNIANKDEAYLELEKLADQRSIPISYISAGDKIKDGEMLLTCLHPVKGYVAANSNSYSTVLSLTYGYFSVLLTGDVETDGENMIIQQLYLNQYQEAGKTILLTNEPNQIPDFDILKVAHHGAKSSSSKELLDKILPKVSIISAGKNNKYGHPHSEVVNRLQEIDSLIYGTYDAGAITITTDGEIYCIEKYLK